MKHGLLSLLLILASCSEQHFTENLSRDAKVTVSKDQINALVQRARWGDGQAYLKLADCYYEGIGVKKDFLGTVAMASLAEKYHGIDDIKDYFSNAPANNEFKLLFNIFTSSPQNNCSIDTVFKDSVDYENADMRAIHGLSDISEGDTLRAYRNLQFAADHGSSIGEILLCITDFNQMKIDPDKLRKIADRVPIANLILGHFYSGYIENEEPDESLAAHYYLKADEHALLGSHGAKWLTDYHDKGGSIKISDADMRRFQYLSEFANDKRNSEAEDIGATAVGSDSLYDSKCVK